MSQAFKDGLLRIVNWSAKICVNGWRRELKRLRNRSYQTQWQVAGGICIFISVILWRPLLDEAFKIGFVFGLSYLWATVVAFGTGLILRTPYMLLGSYIGMVLGQTFGGLQDQGVKQLIGGDLLGGVIIIAFSIYLKNIADQIKNGYL